MAKITLKDGTTKSVPTHYETLAEARRLGWILAKDIVGAVDVSGPKAYGYNYEYHGIPSTTIFLAKEPNKLGRGPSVAQMFHTDQID